MSNPSRLSSLLVRDGIVGVKKMEQAFQRQVIYGGALDTILLEMGLLGEERLAQYLSLATGLPPADRDQLAYFDPRAAQMCSRDQAESFRVAPIAVDGDALRVLVTDPIDLTRLEALATALAVPIQPFVITEYQYHVHRERLYGIPTPSRYAMLAKRAAPPVAPPVTSGEPQIRTTTAFSTDAVARARAERARAKQPTPSPAPPPQATPIPMHDPATAPTMAMAVVPEMPALGMPSGDPRLASPPAGVVRSAWHGGNTNQPQNDVDATPLMPPDASQALLRAEDRDAVFTVLVRAMRTRTTYAALLTVQHDAVLGRVAASHDGIDRDAIGRVAVPLTPDGAFRHAINTRSPYIGTVASQSRGEVDALLAMGGVLPPAALLLPIVIRERVVAMVYAHRGAEPLPVGEMADLLPLAGEAALALSKLILRAKAEGYRKPDQAAAAAALSAEDLPAKKKVRHSWAKAMPSQAPPPSLELSGAVALKADLPGDMPRLLDLVEAGTEPAASLAAEEALARMDELVSALGGRFPGKLWIDRYASGGRVARASQHGPILNLCTRAGSRAVPVLVERMNAEDRETRYYATLACGEVRSMLAIPSLVARLFDADYGVRAAALDALIGYPARDIDAALEPVRRALSGDPTKARAAAHALGELRDVRSIPQLIEVTDRDSTTAEQARRALILLTKQDFSTKAKKWRAWWSKNQNRSRVEWMLDGLAHSDDEVRLSSSEELKRLTGEYFGYHYDLPKREREEARHKWLAWWESTGRRRFLGDPAVPHAEPSSGVQADPRKSP
jgi:GAF domain-containing protein